MLNTISRIISEVVSSTALPTVTTVSNTDAVSSSEPMILGAVLDDVATATDIAPVAETVAKQSDLFVVLMGIGTVFAGLIAIIIICKLMGLFFSGTNNTETSKSEAVAAPVETDEIPNRQEMVAAISAVLAEELGTDVSAIRIHSITRA